MSTAINRLRQAVFLATPKGKQMRRPARWTNDSTSPEEARIEYAIRQAVVAAILFDPVGVEAVLELSDAEIGRLFKDKLREMAGVATVYNLDLPAIREEEENLRRRIKRASKRQRRHLRLRPRA